MAQIHIQQLSKRFGKHLALDKIELTIAQGEFVALVGPSGCGKSTLLRTLAGLEQADSGGIAFDGRAVGHLPPQQRQVAMVFQSYALYPHMTVHDNIAFGLRERGQRETEVRESVNKVATILHLSDLLQRYPRQLSGGQRQRVAMGRAMVREPVAFLFDEPLSNLDAQLRVQMRAEIRELQRQLAVTTVYVTHDQEEAMTMADRIVVMRDGRIEQVDTPLGLYDQPANTFVAQFIGSPPMNLIDAHWQGGRLRIGPDVLLDAPTGARGADGQPVRIGVRPEHLRLVEGAGGGLSGIHLNVRASDHLGAMSELHGEVAGAAVGPRWLARLTGRHHIAAGQAVALSWPVEQTHLFDAQDGIRWRQAA